MFQESTVLRNLAILNALTTGEASLEEITLAARYRQRQIERSLQLLVDQGLVTEAKGRYRLSGDAGQVNTALALIKPWLEYVQESFYEVAKDTAWIIHKKSWEGVNLEGVMLYGSTLRSDKSRDIDLVLFHSGRRLTEFTPPHYAKEGASEIYDVSVEDPSSGRLRAWQIFSMLGYQGKDFTEGAVKYIGKRIEALDAGSISEQRARLLGEVSVSEEDKAFFADFNGVNNVFDVHVLHTGLLGDRKPIEAVLESMRKARYLSYTNQQIAQEDKCLSEAYAKLRLKAIDSCKDPSFWHRVLSEGRIYDLSTHDFTLTVEDKFPGALKLFEA